MSTETAERSGPRTLQEAKQWMHDKLAKRVHPLGLTDPAVTAALIDQLKGLDGDSWAEVWGGAGARHSEEALAAERAGLIDEARRPVYPGLRLLLPRSVSLPEPSAQARVLPAGTRGIPERRSTDAPADPAGQRAFRRPRRRRHGGGVLFAPAGRRSASQGRRHVGRRRRLEGGDDRAFERSPRARASDGCDGQRRHRRVPRRRSARRRSTVHAGARLGCLPIGPRRCPAGDSRTVVRRVTGPPSSRICIRSAWLRL